ncbi:hypothetical protein AB6A40_008800 [Gnathostoma spinigerum]|uniref:Vesicle transport protein USE1 n=1 Tax=Gnathostoma spinigerum TaxID=75299 RepID=A0ABD6EX81_9BILA
MVCVSADEINLQRLLDRSKRLCREDLSKNVWKVSAAVNQLDILFSRLQSDRNLDSDLLMQYGRDVHQIRMVVEAERKKTSEERLRMINLIPSVSPIITSMIYSSDVDQKVDTALRDNQTTGSVEMIKAKSKAVYIADLRKQLLSGTASNTTDEDDLNEIVRREHEKQEELAEELHGLVMSMKQTYSMASNVIKEDNVTLSRMNETVSRNRSNLETEGRRLEEYAYRSWCDFAVLILVLLLFWSFIAMVLVMRVFPKRYSS